MPHRTLYPDLARPPSRPPSRIAAEARGQAAGAPVIWAPEEPAGGNPAETLAVYGVLRLAAWGCGAWAWDGAALRGSDELPALLAATRCWPAGKGGVWTDLAGGVCIAPNRARMKLWAGQVRAAKIWRDCAAAIDAARGIDQTAAYREIPGRRVPAYAHLSRTRYDPGSTPTPMDAGFSPHAHGLFVPLRPVVELLALVGVEGLIRLGGIRRRRPSDGEPPPDMADPTDGRIYLPALAEVPLRDWRDVRRLVAATDLPRIARLPGWAPRGRTDQALRRRQRQWHAAYHALNPSVSPRPTERMRPWHYPVIRAGQGMFQLAYRDWPEASA